MDNCLDCGKLIDQETKAIYCSICKSWRHKLCSNVTDEQYTEVTSSPEPFYYHICISENLPTNLVSLGNKCVSEESPSEIVEIVWRLTAIIMTLTLLIQLCQIESQMTFASFI